MKFTLVEAEIKQALQDYAGKLLTLAPGATIDIEVKATRGTDGVTAEIDVTLPGTTPAAPVQAPVVKTTPAPVEVKPEPTPAPAVVEPVPEQLATATAPSEEPPLPNDDDGAFDETPAEPVAGKSIFD